MNKEYHNDMEIILLCRLFSFHSNGGLTWLPTEMKYTFKDLEISKQTDLAHYIFFVSYLLPKIKICGTSADSKC